MVTRVSAGSGFGIDELRHSGAELVAGNNVLPFFGIEILQIGFRRLARAMRIDIGVNDRDGRFG